MPLLLLRVAATAVFACSPLTGAHSLVSKPAIRWLMLGESAHGTNEMPRAAADLICAAAANPRRVVVALEYATKNQPMINAYIASDGDATARKTLLSAPLWDRHWADGKSSSAMLDFIEWLRIQHQRGRVAGVTTFDANASRNGADREQQMADRLLTIDPGHDGIVIVLTGSFHVRKRKVSPDGTPYAPVGSLLPAEHTVSLRIQGVRGENWSCQKDGCGVHDAEEIGTPKRGVQFKRTADGSYDGILDLGVPTSASLPAKQIDVRIQGSPQ